jgi:uncharacterized protein (DUF849 family)
MSPYLPITPEQIIESAVEAAHAGAAILHLHARDPETGAPSQDARIFQRFLPEIAERCDAILNITTGAGLGMTLDQRLAAARWARPEIASLNMGSFNFNISGAAARVAAFQHDWEKPYLEGTRDFILSNTFAQIESVISDLSETGCRFEFECYDTGHFYNLAHFADRGLVKPPFFIQSIFGILGAAGPEVENLMNARSICNRLFGDDYQMSVLAAGRHQMGFAVVNAVSGGHVRVGLEDNLYISKGKLSQSNAEQVAKIRRNLSDLSIEVATPEETRALLRTKGAQQVGF